MPAPSRHLIVRPGLGISLSDAMAGSTSEWVQVEDKTAGTRLPTPGAPPVLAGYEHHFREESDTPFDYGGLHLIDWLAATAIASRYDGPGQTDVDAGQGGALRFLHDGTDIEIGGSFFDAHRVYWMPGGAAIGVDYLQSQWNPAWLPAYPDGAIGYEVEQYELDNGAWAPLGDPVAAEVSFTLSDETTGGTFFGAITTVALNDRIGDAQMTPTGVVLLNAAPDLNRENAEDGKHGLVQTPVGDPGSNPDLAVTFTVDDFTTVPARSGLFAVWQSVTVPDDLVGTVDSWPDTGLITLVSQQQDFVITYTIRPPRIRWIYPGQPYRRIGQRTDALAGGAARIGQRSKTIQGSNRRGAGAIV